MKGIPEIETGGAVDVRSSEFPECLLVLGTQRAVTERSQPPQNIARVANLVEEFVSDGHILR